MMEGWLVLKLKNFRSQKISCVYFFLFWCIDKKPMRTNIEINEELMDEILNKTKLKTKKEVVDQALRDFLRKIKLTELAELRCKITWDGNLDEMREN